MLPICCSQRTEHCCCCERKRLQQAEREGAGTLRDGHAKAIQDVAQLNALLKEKEATRVQLAAQLAKLRVCHLPCQSQFEPAAFSQAICAHGVPMVCSSFSTDWQRQLFSGLA